MKKPIKITKIKVFDFHGKKTYTGFEADGKDFCYIRPSCYGDYCFAEPKDIESVYEYAGIFMTELRFSPIFLAKSDFESRDDIVKILHIDPATLLANGAEFVEI